MRNIKKKYKRPRTPWNSAQIMEERELLKEYGLRRKRELWRARDILRNFRRRARQLIAEHSEEEEVILVERMVKLGFLSKDAGLEGILALDIKIILDRRLQTLVFKKGHAPTVKTARQMIVHGKIAVGGRKVRFPSYIVPVDRETAISVHEVKHA
jgi:small subunit ribosomal protein S4